jgi:hypothetical protein
VSSNEADYSTLEFGYILGVVILTRRRHNYCVIWNNLIP